MLLNFFHRKNIKRLDDSQLVDEMKSGNTQLVLGEIYNRYGGMLFGVCVKYFKDIPQAEDILMQSFEKLTEKIQKNEIKNLKSWLYTVIRNECLMFLRKNKNQSTHGDESFGYMEDDAEFKLSEKLNNEKFLTLLEKAILELKDEQKICIELFYLKEMSYDEIAIKTKYDMKKIKSYIQNGKRNLKIIIENHENK